MQSHCIPYQTIGLLILIVSSPQSLIGTAKRDSPPINKLSDPIDVVKTFLPYSDQTRSRLINQEFNRRINESHHVIKEALNKVSFAAKHIYTDHDIHCDHMHAAKELQSLHRDYQFDDMFMKLWPKKLKESLDESGYQFHFNHTVESAYQYEQSLLMDVPNIAIKLLVYSGRLLFMSLLSVHAPIISKNAVHFWYRDSYGDSFSAFIYQTTWKYLSDPQGDRARDRSQRLPPFRSISNLHLNRALFQPEMDYLVDLQNEYQLIVWDYNRIQRISAFSTDCVCFYIHAFMHILEWRFESDSDHHFECYLRVEFALKVLEETKSIGDFTSSNDYSSPPICERTCTQFANRIVRFTVMYLWQRDQDSPLLERFLIGLVQSHGFGILFGGFPDKSLDAFIRILRFTDSIYHQERSCTGYQTVVMAKAVYWWYEGDERGSERQMVRLGADFPMPRVLDFEYLDPMPRVFQFVEKLENSTYYN